MERWCTTPPAEAPFVLTLDVGSSSARAFLFDRQARAVPGVEGRMVYSFRATPDGGSEADANDLLRCCESVLDAALKQAGPLAEKISAVAVCTFWHSLLGLDGRGEPATPLTNWADTRASTQGKDLRRRADESAFHARTGCFFHPSYWPARLLWHPRPAARWVSFADYLFLRLFGRAAVSASMASGTGLLDVHRCVWDGETLKLLSLDPAQLSLIDDAPQRGLRPEFARRWPALREVPWYPAAGDGGCNNLGSGCLSPDRIGVMVGTSGAMRVVWRTDSVRVPAGLWTYRVDRRRFALGGALSDGGNLLDWIRATFRIPDEAEREMASMEPDAHGLTFLPFLGGERSPGWDADARASIAGLRFSSRPVEVLRAGLEAVALRFLLIYRLLSTDAHEVVASGAALLGSPAWVQILADALGRPVTASAEAEASSRGAALLVLESLGANLEDLPAAVGRTVEPVPGRHERYLAALERQQRHYERRVE